MQRDSVSATIFSTPLRCSITKSNLCSCNDHLARRPRDVVSAFFRDSMAALASVGKKNFPRGCFFRASVNGTAMVAKSMIKRLYHSAVPMQLRSSFTELGFGILCIATNLSESICSVPPPMINPRHWATNRRCVWKSGAITKRSSRYTKTFDLS